MKVAILHDWLNQLGGAEDVLTVLHDLYPSAPIYTSIYDRERMPPAWSSWDIRSTWMDRLPGIHRHHQPYMPLFALTWAGMHIPAEYDLVLSNKSAFCMGARAAGRHICYCLTPTRFTFDFASYATREQIPGIMAVVLRMLNVLLRRWEIAASRRVNRFIAISGEVQQRIKTYYGRDSEIIYPPVQVERFNVSHSSDDFFLIVSRLLPYKRIDLAVETFNQLGLPLVIAGEGRDRVRLQKMAASNVKLMGRVDDATLRDLLARCRAFVFPGLEDFGIAPINAMACGKPVIAFAGGGALDTVIDGITGVLFDRQTVPSLTQAVGRYAECTFWPDQIRAHAEKYSVVRFNKEILKVIDDLRV
ncbi:MAG: glycosyltransferase [Chloroflexi bacterium]|nr:glycosyltransferase [Chloroflexota bacterium]MCL5275845.1 glycosyltransferase [Chloroflexota bacterium]